MRLQFWRIPDVQQSKELSKTLCRVPTKKQECPGTPSRGSPQTYSPPTFSHGRMRRCPIDRCVCFGKSIHPRRLSITWHVDRWQRSFRISLAKPARTVHSRKPCLGIALRNTSSMIVLATHLWLREGFSECDSQQAFGKYGVLSADQWIMWTNRITSVSSELKLGPLQGTKLSDTK